MNKKKEQADILAIIKYIFENKNTSAKDIASGVGLSDKTVRLKIQSANKLLEEKKLGQIVSKPKVGIYLECNDKQAEKIPSLYQKVQDEVSSERMVQVLRMLLRSIKTKPLMISEIANELYLSAPTAAKEVKEASNWLKGFDLVAVAIRNKGIEITCKEHNYRQAIKEYLQLATSLGKIKVEDELKYLYPGLNVELIKDTLVEVEREWKFRLTDISYLEVLAYLCIATYENINNMECLEENYNKEELQQYNEYNFAAKIYYKLNSRLGIEDKEVEVLFLTLRILCSQVILNPSSNPSELVSEYDKKIREFVERTIEVVSDVVNIDLTNDTRFYQGLLNHTKALVFRLKYGQSIENTMNVYVREKYPNILKVSWLVSVLFEEYFNMSIDDNELCYIALYIQSAIETKLKNFDVILVTNQNMGVTRLLSDRILNSNLEIRKLDVITAHEFNIKEYPDIDLILSTAPLSYDDKRILVLDNLFDDNNIILIKEKLNEVKHNKHDKKFHFDPVCHKLLEPDLMLTNLSVSSKNELLETMCNLLVEKGYATNELYDSVIAREKEANTAVGGGIAIPHGSMNRVNESKIVIATLNKPILWGEEEVSVVVLLNIIISNASELNKWQAFYKEFIKLTDDENAIKKLKNIENPIDLYYYLIQ